MQTSFVDNAAMARTRIVALFLLERRKGAERFRLWLSPPTSFSTAFNGELQ
jgi:hypothetical protein